jgi:hypothetical protein
VSVVPLLLILKPASGPRRHSICVGAAALLALAVGLTTVWLAAARGQAAEPTLAERTAVWYPDFRVSRSWAHAAGYMAASSHAIFLPGDWWLPVKTERDLFCLSLSAASVWLLTLIGLVAWPCRGRLELCCWVVGPWVTMLAAGLAHRYPFAVPRMMQFSAPSIALAASVGVALLARGVSHLVCGRGAPALIGLMFLGALPAAWAFRQASMHRYWVHHDFPAALRILQEQRRSGEPVFVDLSAAPCVQYYGSDLAPPVIAVPTAGGTFCPLQVNPLDLARRCASLAGQRFWILYSDEAHGELQSPTLEVIRKCGYTIKMVASCDGGGESLCSADVLVARRR